jgi:nitrite reductase (NADH) large subunit
VIPRVPGGEIAVASPIYKHHFSLTTGRCFEEAAHAVDTYSARVVAGKVWVQSEPRAVRAPGKRRLIVIGNGIAGMRTVDELLKIAPDAYDIEVFGAEPHGNYNRILLLPVLSGERQVDEIMQQISQRLRAGTNCGSCLPELKAILREHNEIAVWTFATHPI